jgi:hypothetical protein
MEIVRLMGELPAMLLFPPEGTQCPRAVYATLRLHLAGKPEEASAAKREVRLAREGECLSEDWKYTALDTHEVMRRGRWLRRSLTLAAGDVSGV